MCTANNLSLPSSSPNQRFSAIIALLADPGTVPLLKFDWLGERELGEVVLSSLDTVLQRLPSFEQRPWGQDKRGTRNLRPVGLGLPDPLATHPVSHCLHLLYRVGSRFTRFSYLFPSIYKIVRVFQSRGFFLHFLC